MLEQIFSETSGTTGTSFGGTAGTNICEWSGLFTCYNRSSLRKTAVIVWDGFECERGKGWDCEEAAALEFVSL